jgi:hypothetical protein
MSEATCSVDETVPALGFRGREEVMDMDRRILADVGPTHPQAKIFSVDNGGKRRSEIGGKSTHQPPLPVSSLVIELHACRSQPVDECGRGGHRVWKVETTLV